MIIVNYVELIGNITYTGVKRIVKPRHRSSIGVLTKIFAISVIFSPPGARENHVQTAHTNCNERHEGQCIGAAEARNT